MYLLLHCMICALYPMFQTDRIFMKLYPCCEWGNVMSKYTAKSKEYTAQYVKEHLDEIKIRVPKGRKEVYKAAASSVGKSLNQFAVDSMENEINRMEQNTSPASGKDSSGTASG